MYQNIVKKVLNLTNVSPSTKSVLMYLAVLSNNKGECSPSLYDISKHTSLSKSTVIRSLELLRNGNILTISKRSSGDRIVNNFYKFSSVTMTLPEEDNTGKSGKVNIDFFVQSGGGQTDEEWCHHDTTTSVTMTPGSVTMTLPNDEKIVEKNLTNPKQGKNPSNFENYFPHYSIARAPAYEFLNIINNIPVFTCLNDKIKSKACSYFYIHKKHEYKNTPADKKNKPETGHFSFKNWVTCKKCGEGNGIHPDALAAMEYFNLVTGKRIVTTSASNIRFLHGRIGEGATLDELKAVIDWKKKDWKGTSMWQYMRPKTLFCETNFTNYLCEISNPEELAKKRLLSEKVMDEIKKSEESGKVDDILW